MRSKILQLLLCIGLVACKKEVAVEPEISHAGRIQTIRIETTDSSLKDPYTLRYRFSYDQAGRVDSINWLNAEGRYINASAFERHPTYFVWRHYIGQYLESTDSFRTDSNGTIRQAFLALEQGGYGEICRFTYDSQQQLIAFEAVRNRGGLSQHYTFRWQNGNVVQAGGTPDVAAQYQYDPGQPMQEADFLNVLSLLEWGQPVIVNKQHLSGRQSPSGTPLLTDMQFENGRIRSYRTVDNCSYPVKYSFTYYE